MRVGIFGVSTQSGKAYLADLVAMGFEVYGYARPTAHGTREVDAIRAAGGVRVERPPNNIGDVGRHVAVEATSVGHEVRRLLDCQLILVTHPSTFHEETASILRDAGVADARTTLVLSPGRSLAAPHLWRILGPNHPVVSLSTCPYSCKHLEPGAVYIKRRKRSWIASREGDVPDEIHAAFRDVFPQMLSTRIPGVTSLGNMGAVLHPATYLINLEDIEAARARGEPFPFYVRGIVENDVAARALDAVDQTRLRVAHAAGLTVYGRHEDPKHEEWQRQMARFRSTPEPTPESIVSTRRLWARRLAFVSDCVVSLANWLDYTYGVTLDPSQTVQERIARASVFTYYSFPQDRYLTEDLPTGLVPLEALALRLRVDASPVSDLLDRHDALTGGDVRAAGRNLATFTTEELVRYLRGA